MLTESPSRWLSDTDATRSAYRIVVTLLDGDVVYNGRPIRTFKRARAQVAAAVRHFAAASRVVSVTVQRHGDPLFSQLESHYAFGSPSSPADERWTVVEHWDTTVVARILAQGEQAPREPRPASPTVTRHTLRGVPAPVARPTFAPLALQPKPTLQVAAVVLTPPPREHACPSCTCTEAAVAAPDRAAAIRALPAPEPKRHRFGVVSVVIAIALLCATQALVISGGKPVALLLSGTTRPAPVHVLPFERTPQATDARQSPNGAVPELPKSRPQPALARQAAP